ncbi:MAG: master DNA invertase Mpi family serine-type recombinase [Candidatus Spyradenecus sp.]
MTYGYIRVSTDKQTVENQRYEIQRFCQSHGLTVDGWIEETVSGTTAYTQRALGRLLRRTRPGDLILCAELSRLGRSLLMIMEILNRCLARGCKVWSIKDGYRLGEDIQSKVLAFAFGLSAEIERNLIAQRTREALARRRNEGHPLGRPRGSTIPLQRLRLYPHRERIARLLAQGCSQSLIASKLRVSRSTLSRFLALATAEAQA